MNFFPDATTNDEFTAWKQEILDCTAHGWVPSDTYLLQVFTEGKLTVDQVAYDADLDWEHEDSLEQDRITLYDDGVPVAYGYAPATRMVCSNSLIWGVDNERESV